MLGIAASGQVQRLLPTASLVLAVLTYSMPATAEEQTLKGRLVVTQPTGASTALPSFGGHTFVANKYSGVAVFEDGLSPISSTLNRATTPRRVETSRVTAPTPSKTVIHSP
jgi:hypothetical protein